MCLWLIFVTYLVGQTLRPVSYSSPCLYNTEESVWVVHSKYSANIMLNVNNQRVKPPLRDFNSFSLGMEWRIKPWKRKSPEIFFLFLLLKKWLFKEGWKEEKLLVGPYVERPHLCPCKVGENQTHYYSGYFNSHGPGLFYYNYLLVLLIKKRKI